MGMGGTQIEGEPIHRLQNLGSSDGIHCCAEIEIELKIRLKHNSRYAVSGCSRRVSPRLKETLQPFIDIQTKPCRIDASRTIRRGRHQNTGPSRSGWRLVVRRLRNVDR